MSRPPLLPLLAAAASWLIGCSTPGERQAKPAPAPAPAPAPPAQVEPAPDAPPAPSAGSGRLRIIGSGKEQGLDVSDFPPDQRARYDLFQARCTVCHSLAQPLTALVTGTAPATGARFDEDFIKAYVVNRMREPHSGITKDDAPEIILLLHWLLDLAHPTP